MNLEILDHARTSNAAEMLGGFGEPATACSRESVSTDPAVPQATIEPNVESPFMAGIGSEIREPMTAILGFVEILAEDGDLAKAPKQRLEAIESIRNNAQQLLEVLDDLFQVAQMEAGQLVLEQAEVRPADVVNEALSRLVDLARQREVRLIAEYDGALPEVILGMPKQLRSLLFDLLHMHVASTQGGTIVLSVRYDGDSQGRPVLVFSILRSDSGATGTKVSKPPCPPSADGRDPRWKMWPGLRAHRLMRLAQIMGGTLESDPTRLVDAACRLTVSAPAKNGEPGASADGMLRFPGAASEDVQAADSLEGLRVLLVEDGPDNQRLISYFLRKAGAEVEIAENGEVAVRAMDVGAGEAYPFDVLLMDMQMPVMDGYQATRELRRAAYPGPIIAVTAHAMAEDRDRCLDAGCDEYLTKPIDRRKLLATIRDVARRRGRLRRPTQADPGDAASAV